MHGVEEVLVGIDHPSVRRKLDHRHRPAQGIHDALGFVLFIDSIGDIRSHLDHAHNVLLCVDDGHITGFKPHLTPGLVEP